MAAKLEIILFYNEEINRCEVTWSSDLSADPAPKEKIELEKLKNTLKGVLESGIPHGQVH